MKHDLERVLSLIEEENYDDAAQILQDLVNQPEPEPSLWSPREPTEKEQLIGRRMQILSFLSPRDLAPSEEDGFLSFLQKLDNFVTGKEAPQRAHS